METDDFLALTHRVLVVAATAAMLAWLHGISSAVFDEVGLHHLADWTRWGAIFFAVTAVIGAVFGLCHYGDACSLLYQLAHRPQPNAAPSTAQPILVVGSAQVLNASPLPVVQSVEVPLSQTVSVSISAMQRSS